MFRIFHPDVHFSGGSGGSWAALLLATKVDIRFALEMLLEYGPHCAKGRLCGAYGVYDRGMKEVHNKVFEGIDLARVLNGKLAISITRITLGDSLGVIPILKDEVISEFYSNNDVIECIVASALIPFALNGYPFVRFRDWICVDAGLTNVAGVRRFFGTSATAQELFHDTIARDSGDRTDGSFARIASLSSHYFKLVAEYLASNSLTKNCFTKFLDSRLNSKIQCQLSAGNDCNQCAPLTYVGNNIVNEDVEAILNARNSSSGHKSASPAPKGKITPKEPSRPLGTTTTNKENEGAGIFTPVVAKFTKAPRSVLTDNSKKLFGTPKRGRGRASSDAETVLSEMSFRSDLPTIPRVSAPYGLVQLGYMTTKAVSLHLVTDITEHVTDAIVSAADKFLPISVAKSVSAIVTSVVPRDFLDGVLKKCVPLALRKKIAEKISYNTKAIEAGDSNQIAFRSIDSTDGTINGSEMIFAECDVDNDDNVGASNTALTTTSTGFSIRKMEKEAMDALTDLLSGISSPLVHPCSRHDSENDDTDSTCSSGEDEDSDLDCASRSTALPNSALSTAATYTPSRKERIHGYEKDNSVGHLWNTKGHIIKKLEHGGLLLEIAPWTWRRQPLFHYHLTSDPQQVQRLFDLGYADAKKHHREINKFFKRSTTAK